MMMHVRQVGFRRSGVLPSHSRRRLCCGGTGSPPNSVKGLPRSQSVSPVVGARFPS